MFLFPAHLENLLPNNGEVHYYGVVYGPQQADGYFQALMATLEWRNDEAVIFGRHITTRRKVAWYGDKPFAYTYSKVTRYALPWTDALQELKTHTEQVTGQTFNSCLLNLYNDGADGVAWHSDDERELGATPFIASVSFGAARKFSFRNKATRETLSVTLENGSLLTMAGETQRFWLHCIPKTRQVLLPRINLTFRNMLG